MEESKRTYKVLKRMVIGNGAIELNPGDIIEVTHYSSGWPEYKGYKIPIIYWEKFFEEVTK